MILINLLLDIILTNHIILHSYFYISNIFKVRYRYFIIIPLTSILVDLFITHTYGYNVILLTFLYFIEKKFFLKKDNFLTCLLLNIFNYFIYSFGLYLYFNIKSIDIIFFLKNCALSIIIYVIYCLISYKLYKNS